MIDYEQSYRDSLAGLPPRSNLWPAMSALHLAKHPWCKYCGGTEHLVAHHIRPYHLAPGLELQGSNLITLCNGEHGCHFFAGHLGNWKRWNPYASTIANSPEPGYPRSRCLQMMPMAGGVSTRVFEDLPGQILAHKASPPIIGRMSTFGGADDTGVGPTEGLALIEPADLAEEWFAALFIPFAAANIAAGAGLARNLDPSSYYIAMRWDYTVHSRETIRRSLVIVSAANGRSRYAQPADWGPNEDTGRVADVSPGLAADLGVSTDDVIAIQTPW